MAGGRGTIAEMRLVLATDLDGTFAGGTAADRARLQARLALVEGFLLIYATGRSVPSAQRLIEDVSLPEPDILIADVGTSVVQGSGGEPVTEIEADLARRWPGGDAVRERLASVPNLVDQEVHAPRRVSYDVVRGTVPDAVETASARLRGLGVDVVGSAGVYLDVLPGGVNKGTTLRRVVEWLGCPEAAVVVAGDSLNDLALLVAGYRGIVVGNCEPALRDRVGGRAGVYLAEGTGAAGILEGLGHFGWPEEVSNGE